MIGDINYRQKKSQCSKIQNDFGFFQMHNWQGGDDYEVVCQISVKVPTSLHSEHTVWLPYIPLSHKPSHASSGVWGVGGNNTLNDGENTSTNFTPEPQTHCWGSYIKPLAGGFNRNNRNSYAQSSLNNHRIYQSQWHLFQNLEIESVTHDRNIHSIFTAG